MKERTGRRTAVRAGERGAEIIELAFALPILLLILAGIFDFGMLFRNWEVVTNAAREGARVGVLPGYNESHIVSRVQQYMAASGIVAACTPCGEPSLCSVCVGSEDRDLSGAGSGPMVRVRRVSVISEQKLPSLGMFGSLFGGSLGTVNVGSTSEMRVESGPVAP